MSEARARHLYDRPIGVLAVLTALMVLGGMTLPSMRINLKPAGLTAPLIYVSMTMDTESTAEALEGLTRPTEEILRSLPGVETVSSRTRGNSVRVYVMPAANVSLSMLTSQVSEALDNNSYRLPSTTRPSIGTFSESDPPMVAAAFNPGKYDDATFRDFMERLPVAGEQRQLRRPELCWVVHRADLDHDRWIASETGNKMRAAGGTELARHRAFDVGAGKSPWLARNVCEAVGRHHHQEIRTTASDVLAFAAVALRAHSRLALGAVAHLAAITSSLDLHRALPSVLRMATRAGSLGAARE